MHVLRFTLSFTNKTPGSQGQFSYSILHAKCGFYFFNFPVYEQLFTMEGNDEKNYLVTNSQLTFWPLLIASNIPVPSVPSLFVSLLSPFETQYLKKHLLYCTPMGNPLHAL